MEIANILNFVIAIGVLVYKLWTGQYNSLLMYKISAGLKIIQLMTWSYALYSLFTNFKASKNLLPRKRVFITHAVLLTIYLLANVSNIVVAKILFGGNCDRNCLNKCWSIYYFGVIVSTVSEVITFVYVVYSQISFTGRKEALKNVLLCGKTTIEDVERAVLE